MSEALQQRLEQAIERFGAESGTIHVLGEDGVLHLQAASGIPKPVLEIVQLVLVGKGMAGLAVERQQPVNACNIQTDTSGDVRPGAKATGMEGAIVVPMMRDGRAVGAFGIANRRERVFGEDEIRELLAMASEAAAELS